MVMIRSILLSLPTVIVIPCQRSLSLALLSVVSYPLTFRLLNQLLIKVIFFEHAFAFHYLIVFPLNLVPAQWAYLVGSSDYPQTLQSCNSISFDFFTSAYVAFGCFFFDGGANYLYVGFVGASAVEYYSSATKKSIVVNYACNSTVRPSTFTQTGNQYYVVGQKYCGV